MLLTAYLISGDALGVDLTSWTSTELGGNPAFKAEDTVSAGYEDISSIENWDSFGSISGKDYAFVRLEIKTLVDAAGYGTLTDNQKKVALQYFVAGGGNDYVDVLYTDAEYKTFYDAHLNNMKVACNLRDEAVHSLAIKKVYIGVLTQVEVAAFVNATVEFRTLFLRDFVFGTAYGNSADGILDWTENTGGCVSVAITGVDIGTSKFTVSGNYRRRIQQDSNIYIRNSTGNDGLYTVSSSTRVGPNTEVKVEEVIADATVDGDIFWIGFKSLSAYSSGLVTEVVDIYYNGIY